MTLIQRFAPLLIVFLAAPVLAQDLVMADDPAKIVEIARGFGSAELEAEEDGTPKIRARMDGTRYMIYFYGCDQGKECTSIQFWTYVTAPKNAVFAANDWNSRRRFGSAFVDEEGDLVVAMDVNLWGGVSPKNLDDTFDWWRVILDLMREEFPEDLTPPERPDQTDGSKTL